MSFLFESVNRERSLSDLCSETSASSSSSDHPVALAALAPERPPRPVAMLGSFFYFRERTNLSVQGLIDTPPETPPLVQHVIQRGLMCRGVGLGSTTL